MGRKLSDIRTDDNWPQPGWARCECVDVGEGAAAGQGNPFVVVTWEWDGGRFRDRLYVTAKTVGRLAAFVQRLLEVPDDLEWPDDDNEAADKLAGYIIDHAQGVMADVQVVERLDTKGKMRTQVSYAGYRAVRDATPSEPTSQPAPEGDAPPDQEPEEPTKGPDDVEGDQDTLPF